LGYDILGQSKERGETLLERKDREGYKIRVEERNTREERVSCMSVVTREDIYLRKGSECRRIG